MSRSKDYTITTLSNNLSQRNKPVFSQAVNNSISLRNKCSPYTVVRDTVGSADENIVKFPFGCLTGTTVAQSYIEPFVYYNFETSGSTYVTNVQGTNTTYTGSLTSQRPPNAAPAADKRPHYTEDAPFSGQYSMGFGKTEDAPGYDDDRAFVNFGRPVDRSNWGTLFSGSWSISMWFKPSTIQNYRGLFHLKDPNQSVYSFMFVIGDNTGSEGPVGWYGSGGWRWWTPKSPPECFQPQSWGHLVFAISGSVDTPSDRYVKAFINGQDLGYLEHNFEDTINETHHVMLGSWYQSPSEPSWDASGSIDEVSIWDSELNEGQAAKLYNNGLGMDAMTALTQSS